MRCRGEEFIPSTGTGDDTAGAGMSAAMPDTMLVGMTISGAFSEFPCSAMGVRVASLVLVAGSWAALILMQAPLRTVSGVLSVDNS